MLSLMIWMRAIVDVEGYIREYIDEIFNFFKSNDDDKYDG